MYSYYLRECIVQLSKQYKGKALVAVLHEEGFNVSSLGAYYVLKCFKETGSIFDRPRSGRPTILSGEALRMIDEWLHENDEMTTTELMQKLNEMDHHASRATVGRARFKLNWSAKPTRYCQLIREVNKYKCVEFCQNLLASAENFDNIIFTDETVIQLVPAKRKIFHKKGEIRKYRPKAKRPAKVYLWAGISKKEPPNVLFLLTSWIVSGTHASYKQDYCHLFILTILLETIVSSRIMILKIPAELPKSSLRTITLNGGAHQLSHQI